jgi:5-methylcytosine-specific restriction endonuclease McrA
MDEIIEVGLDLILERQAKRRGLVKNPRKNAPEEPSPQPAEAVPSRRRTRYVPAAVRRAIWKRDDGKCQWKLDGGGICGSTRQLEIDHLEPFAKGGRIETAEDGRILCKFHQDVSAREVYGDAVMNAYTKPKGGRCSEPVAAYATARGIRPPLRCDTPFAWATSDG